KAFNEGLTDEDIIIDGLVATIGAEPYAAVNTLDTIKYCKEELKIPTVCGLSNISFGLPDRMFVNSSFMSMAIMAGLTMAIANPGQELLMHAVMAADLLMNKAGSDERYINRVGEQKISVVEGEVSGSDTKTTTKTKKSNIIPEEFEEDKIFTAVVKGKKELVISLIKEALEENEPANKILDNRLIPAINQVGVLFDKNIYYLPQLISSAEAMSAGVEVLEPHLNSGESGDSKGTVVIATVEHDIHDIGKNLVALMLKNYGYNVIDLGKDVKTEDIIRTAKEEDADIIGLSALMTTTMMEMKKVVEEVKKNGLKAKVMIGGACITEGFMKEIGADGYSEDAKQAVEVADKLMGL
nr:cobalamin-dependent protein [Lachnospiraceae bacterium]